MPRKAVTEKKTEEQVDVVQRFIDELNEQPVGEHVLFGMVKPAEKRDGLMFAHAGGCGHWIHIPKSAIASIISGSRIPCRGHSHATAEIQLKAPQSELEETFVRIAGLHRARLEQVLASALHSGLKCGHDEHKVTDSYGNERCEKNGT